MSPESKPGQRPKLEELEQLFMFFTWLRLGFTQSYAGFLFNLPISTVCRYTITWSNYMYLKLESIPIWPTREQTDKTMPKCFKETYPLTRVILDCTELFCQRPSSLTIQSSLFSFYKHHVADRGFTIAEELRNIGVSLNIPSLLSGRNQLTEEEVTESQTIAAVRIHVERAIQRIKKFRQIRNEMTR